MELYYKDLLDTYKAMGARAERMFLVSLREAVKRLPEEYSVKYATYSDQSIVLHTTNDIIDTEFITEETTSEHVTEIVELVKQYNALPDSLKLRIKSSSWAALKRIKLIEILKEFNKNCKAFKVDTSEILFCLKQGVQLNISPISAEVKLSNNDLNQLNELNKKIGWEFNSLPKFVREALVNRYPIKD